MLKDAYELIVMFFRLTNLLETFQIMMNDLLKDLIEIGDIVAFIDDIMVGMETEKGNFFFKSTIYYTECEGSPW